LWYESVDKAVPIYDFYIDSAKKRFGTDTPEGKKSISEELAPVLGKISNSVVLSHYVKKLAQVLAVSEEAVSEEISKSQRTSAMVKSDRIKATPAMPESRQERLGQYLLALSLPLGKKASDVLDKLKPEWLDQSASAQALLTLKDWLNQHPGWQINAFVAALPEELVAAVDQGYLTDLKQLNDDEEALNEEAIKTVFELKHLAVKAKLNTLSDQIKQAEADHDKQKIARLQRDFVETSKILGYNHD
jgi:DNA primase